MYMREGRGCRPFLDLRLDEPALLRMWFLNLPTTKMNTEWGLDISLRDIWYEHFNDRILSPNYYGSRRIDSNRQMIGGHVPGSSLSATMRKWDDWMSSSSDPSKFASVKLRAFMSRSGDYVSPLLLAPDAYCFGCDDLEPSWLYAGMLDRYGAIHEQYRTMIDELLNHGMFGYQPELAECPTCHPETRYATPAFVEYARRRPGLCECMPCQRSL